MTGFVTAAEVCDYLQISKATLTRLTQKRLITSARFGRRVVYRWEWVEEYVVRCTTKRISESDSTGFSSEVRPVLH